jgi:hypothetical protein
MSQEKGRVVFIVMVAPECAPVAVAGGLGEVISGLSRELELRGHAVDIILPKYNCMRYDQIYSLARGAQFILLGNCPDPAVNAHFWRLKHDLNIYEYIRHK